MLAIKPPFTVFAARDGTPLDGGSIYFGVANQNPETNPQVVYWDAAGTQPAAQPLRTVGGYIVRAGTPAVVYTNTGYSITVRDSDGSMVYTMPTSSDYSSSITLAGFGAVGDGVTDDTAAFQAAINALQLISIAGDGVGRPVLAVPAAKYLVGSLTINKRLKIKGDGSGSSFIQLKAGVTTPLFTVNAEDVGGTSLDDSNHTIFEGLTLQGNRVDSVTTGASHGIYCPDAPWTITTQYSNSIMGVDLHIEGFTGCNLYFGGNRNWALLDRVISRYSNDCGLKNYGYDNRISKCDFGVNLNYGAWDVSGGGNVYEGCNIYFNLINSVVSSFVNNFILYDGCAFDAALQNAISHGGSCNVKAIGCQFDGNSRAGAGLYSDILKATNSSLTVIGNNFILSGQKVKYLIEVPNPWQPNTIFSGNDYIHSGASTPYTSVASNVPAVLLGSDDIMINVMRYGVYGDGITDDSAAINAALAAAAGTGRTVYFPYATYVCAAQIVADRVKIKSDAAQLKFTTVGAAVDCLVLQASTAFTPLEVDGLIVNCNNVGRDGVVVTGGGGGFSSSDFMSIRRMFIQQCVRDGLVFQPSAANNWIQNPRVSDTRILSPGRHGITIICPALANIFVTQGVLDNVDIRGAGQTTTGYDMFVDLQGSAATQKASEWMLMSCDFDASGAANHAQGSLCFSQTGTNGSISGWTFNCFTPEDTGAVITGTPNIIQIVGTPAVNGVFRLGGITSKYGELVDTSKATRVFNRSATAAHDMFGFDLSSVGFAASYANDAAAAAAGVALGNCYRNGSAVSVRVV